MHTTKSIITLVLLLSVMGFAQKKAKPSTEKYSGKIAIFFGPTQAEFDSLAKDESSGIDEVISDFQFYADKIEPYLKSYEIKSAMTSAQLIEVKYSKKTQTYERLKSEHIVGVILSDGVQEPKMYHGVMTDEDLKMILVEYFNLN